jgi:hypothetical protein
MTDTLNTTTNARPAKLSPPSDRDLEIFQLAQIHGRTHLDISLAFEVSRRRVGQIVHDVRHWLSLHGTDDPVIHSQIQRQRLDRALERMYLMDIIHRAVHGLNNAPPVLTTSTHINDRCVKKVMRDQPLDSRLLKTYLQAVNSLGKLNERQPLPELPSQPWKHSKIQAVVDDWSEKNKEYSLDPEEFDQFAQELTATIQSCLESSPPQGSPPTPSGTEADECLDSDEVCTTNPTAATPHSELRTPHSPAALPSASLPSLPEAPSNQPAAGTELAPSPSPAVTSNDASLNQSTAPASETSLQKPEKGSADPHTLTPSDTGTSPASPSPTPPPPSNLTFDLIYSSGAPNCRLTHDY